MAEDLTCSSCHRLYEDPRILSCLHSICFQCITKGSPVECTRCSTVTSSSFAFPVNVKLNRQVKQEALIKKFRSSVYCSSCRHNHVACYYCPNCQDEFLCRNCYSAHQLLKFTRSHSCLPLNKAKSMSRTDLIAMSSFSKPRLCQYHNKTLNKYCRKCAVPICEECMTHIHKDHYCIGDSSIARDRESIKRSIRTMEDSLKKADSSLTQGKSQENVHKTQKKSAYDEITKAFDVLHSAIDKREQELLSQCDEAAADADNRLKRFVSNVKLSVDHISESLSFAKEALEYTDEEELVGISRVVSERATALDQELAKYSRDTNQITLELNTKDALKAIQTCGSLSKQVLHQSSSQPSTTCTQANVSTAMTLGQDSAHPSKALLSKSSSKCLVTPPLQVFNFVDQCFRSSTQITGICSPKALAFDDDNNLFVTSSSSEVSVFNTNILSKRLSGLTFNTPRKLGKKGTGSLEFLSPAGIAVKKNLVYVTDEEANRVQVFTTAGKFVSVHGGKDSNIFSKPKDIKIGPDSKIYIADTGNFRVLVFSKDWTLSHKIYYTEQSPKGSSTDTDYPHGISFDQSGDVHIVWRYRSPSITVHDKHGKYIRSYGSVYLRRGVAGIAIDSRNCSYVLDGDIGFKVFFPDGEKRYEIRNFNCPEGLAMNQNGQVWVADTNNNRLATVEFEVRFS